MSAACSTCGLPVSQADVFCGNCGHRTSPPDSMSPMVIPTVASAGAEPAPWPAASATGPGFSSHGATLGSRTGSPARPSPAGDRVPASAALGQATPNATYIGQRLLYEKEPEAPFDPIINPRFRGHLARQVLLFVIVYAAGAVVSAIFFGILAVSGVGFLSAFGIWYICGELSAVALFIVFLLLPVTALLSEWKFLIDDKGAAGPIVFEHIIFALRRRQTPLESIQIRRLRLPGGEARDYLELRRGIFTGFISCFAQGQDLYVGWTLWLSLSPFLWLIRLVARLWQNIIQRGTDLYLTLRYESAKAMREAMHSAAREGIDVAVGQLTPQGQGISSAIPVVTADIRA